MFYSKRIFFIKKVEKASFKGHRLKSSKERQLPFQNQHRVGQKYVRSSHDWKANRKVSLKKWRDNCNNLPVDFAVRCITQIGWVKGSMAISTVEATLVPWMVFTDHLFSSKYHKSTTWAASSISRTSSTNTGSARKFKENKMKVWPVDSSSLCLTYKFNVDSPLDDKVGVCPYPKPFGPNKRP